MPLTWYNSPDSKITNVAIIDGKYDRIDEFSFYMYIICSVTFYYEGIFQQQCYCVNGYCNIAEKSDFLCDVSIYDGKRFRLKNPLNEFLVPILPKKRYDETALQILSNYYPFRYDIPCVISGLALAKEMGYHIQYAVSFIECLSHTKGTWAGKKFELLGWQEQIIRDLFGVLKPNGYRQFNTAYIEIPKKMARVSLQLPSLCY